MSNPSINTVIEFGLTSFIRLEDIHSDIPPEQRHHRKISELTDKKMIEIQSVIQKLINERKVYILDKEFGIAHEASIVIGFKDNCIVICCER